MRVAGGNGATQLAPAFEQGDLRRCLMAAMAVFHPNQAKARGQLYFAVADLYFYFTPFREARAADVAQAGDAMANALNSQNKIFCIEGANCKVSRGGVTPGAAARGLAGDRYER